MSKFSLSRINEHVKYNDTKLVDDEDTGHISSLYVLSVYGEEIVIALGKPKYTFSNHNVIYFPIYFVFEDIIQLQIGIYEINIHNVLNVYDKEGDVDLKKLGEPIFYSYVNKSVFTEYNLKENIKFYDEKPEPKSKDDKTITEKVEDNPKDDEIEEIDDIFKLNDKNISPSTIVTNEIIKNGIFEKANNTATIELLSEETELIANEIKQKFKKSSQNKWIQNFTKNKNYNILANEGGGDCLFAVIRDAFKTIGQNTTVQKLRALLSSNLTEEIFNSYRNLYLELESINNQIKEEMNKLKIANKVFKSRLQKCKDPDEKLKIIKEGKNIEQMFNNKKNELADNTKLQIETVGHMSDIDNIDKMRDYINTSRFWADTWSISTLEELLKIKLIILSKESYLNEAIDTVLNCGEGSKKTLNDGRFEPNYYIITSYDGSHYELITYKQRGIFIFSEIPYDIKIMIVNKCMEKSAGVFHIIPDFSNFKSKLGIVEEQEILIEEESSQNEPIFVFHSNSMDGKPRKGTSEKIDVSQMLEYNDLFKINNWRRKLDDSWVSPFTLDGHQWASVEHYKQASKFKKGFPDFYVLFSLDNPSDLSNDPKIAKINGDMSKKKNAEFRPKNVKIDVDYPLGRNDIEREIAIFSKFDQNDELKRILVLTKNAILKQYIKGSPAITDTILMNARKKFNQR